MSDPILVVALPGPAAPPAPASVGPNVGYVRREYHELLPKWELIRDCLAGETQVKHRGDVYLPRPNPTDTSEENEARFDQYVARAVFYNATGRTHVGLVGQVFCEEPKFTVPKLIEDLEDNVDGAGVTLQQQSQKALGLTLAHGRAGLWVDYPAVEGAVSRKQLADGAVRPNIILLEPWDVINWRTITIGGITKLALVVMTELFVTDDDGFEEEVCDMWRVLRLDDKGLYVVEEWVKEEGEKEIYKVRVMDNGKEARFFPTDSAGKRLDHIPFTFIGANNNDPTPDLPPMYDLASLNIAHYRNSADYEEAVYIAGQPTPVLIGLTEEWVKDVLKGTVQLGSRAAVALPVGGDAKMLQAEANSMPHEAMEQKEKQMVAIGARLVEQQAVQRTATEAGYAQNADSSILATVAGNVSEAYEAALKFALDFLDVTDTTDITFELNDEFFGGSISSQDRAQAIAEWQGNAITFEELRAYLKRAGVAYVPDEEAKTTIEGEALMKPVTAAPAGKPPTKKGEDPPKKDGLPLT